PRFEILEDVLSTNLEAEALTDCLQRLLTAGSQEGEDLRQLVLLYGWRPAVTTIQHLMRSEDVGGWDKWLDRPTEQIAADWQTYARETLLPRFVEHVLTASPKIAHCLGLLRRIQPRPDSKMADKVRRLLDLTPRLAEVSDLKVALEELKECAKVGGE